MNATNNNNAAHNRSGGGARFKTWGTKITFLGGNVDCVNYCRMSAEQVETGPVESVFPKDSLSDHKLVASTIAVGANNILVRVAAWNVLNKKYAQTHMVKSTHGQPLDEHDMASRDAAKQTAREKAVLDLLDMGPAGFDIICLQEVSSDLFDAIVAKFAAEKIFTDRAKLNADGTLKDCNLIIARRGMFKVVKKELFFHEDEKTPIHAFRFKIRNNDGLTFNVVTAHMPWDNKNAFPGILLAADIRAPTLICGDFNCGVRLPVLNNGVDSLLKYSDPRFVFPNPATRIGLNQPHAQKGATHVCCMRNIGYNKERLLDVFDHIVLLLPPPVQQAAAAEQAK